MATTQVAAAAALDCPAASMDETAAALPLSAHGSAFPSAPAVAAAAAVSAASLSAAAPQPVPSPAAAPAVTGPASKRNATSMLKEKHEGDAQKEAGPSKKAKTEAAASHVPLNAVAAPAAANASASASVSTAMHDIVEEAVSAPLPECTTNEAMSTPAAAAAHSASMPCAAGALPVASAASLASTANSEYDRLTCALEFEDDAFQQSLLESAAAVTATSNAAGGVTGGAAMASGAARSSTAAASTARTGAASFPVHAAAAAASAPAAASSSTSQGAASALWTEARQLLQQCATDAISRMSRVRRFCEAMRPKMSAEIVNHWTPRGPNAPPLLRGKQTATAALEDSLTRLNGVSGVERAKRLQTIFGLMGLLFKETHGACLSPASAHSAFGAAAAANASALASMKFSRECEGAWLLFLAEDIHDHSAPLFFYLHNNDNEEELTSLHWNASLVLFGQTKPTAQQSSQPKAQRSMPLQPCSLLATLMARFSAIETEYESRQQRVRECARQERARLARFSSDAAPVSSLPEVFDPRPNLWEPLLAVLEASAQRVKGHPQLALSGVRNARGEGLLAQLTRLAPPPDSEQHWAYRFAQLFLQAGCRADGRRMDGSSESSIGGGAAAAATSADSSAGNGSPPRSPLENWLYSQHPLHHACGLVLLLRHGAPAQVNGMPLLVYLARSRHPPLLNQLLDAAQHDGGSLRIGPLARGHEGDTFAHALFERCLTTSDNEQQKQLLAVLLYEENARPMLWFKLQLAEYLNDRGETLAKVLTRQSGDGLFLFNVQCFLHRVERQYYKRIGRILVEPMLAQRLNRSGIGAGGTSNALGADHPTGIIMEFLFRTPKKPNK